MAIKKTSKPSKSEAPKRPLSLAEIWDNTDASEASNNLPAGEHEVRVNSIELKDDPKKGKAAIITYEAIDGDHEGKTLRQLYKLSDPAGGKGPGVAFLMRDLALMGYDDIDGKKLKKTLQEISEEQPMVIINAVENGQYTNAYLQGLPENVEKSDDDDDDEEEDEVELAVGDTVTGEDDDGEEVTGEIVKINKKKGVATVKDEEDEEHVCDLSGLAKSEGEADDDGDDEEEAKPIKKAKGKKAEPEEEEEEESEEIEVGDSVTWEDEDGDEQSGTVKKIKGTKVIVEDDDEDEHTVKLGDLSKA